MEFFRTLSSPNDFMPHGYCYLWNPRLVWLHVISDFLIALAYFSIPITLVHFIRKRKDVPFNWIFICFGIFILACGGTHVMEIWNLWHADYWLSGGIKVVTAVASVATAILLVRLIPQALALPSPEAMKLEIAERKRAQEDLAKAKDELEIRVQERTAKLQKANDDFTDEILQRNLAEEALRRSEERFRLLVESVQDYAIFMLDTSGRVTSWNQGAEHINGYQAKEIIGKHFSRFYQDDDIELGKPETGLKVAVAEGRFEEYGWRTRKDGSKLWANVIITALRNPRGELMGFSKITRDLPEQMRTEAALRGSEEQLRMAQEASGSGAWDWDPQSDLATWSDRHSQIFGLGPDDVKHTWSSFLHLVDPGDRARVQLAILTALKSQGALEVEYRINRPDGQARWVMSKGRAYCDSAGEPMRMVGLTMDITERKQLEHDLLKTQSDLARISRLLTLGELTSSIAHEVNQPLVAVVTNGDACMRWLAAEPPKLDKVRESLAWIVKEGKRAGEIIKRIRELAKNKAPQKTELLVNDVITEAVNLAGSELSNNQVILRTGFASDRPTVCGDRVQLQQVILNLIANAIDAMKSIHQHPRELSISSKATDDGQILITVRDCGTGVEPNVLENVFKAFFTTKKEGMGLGLSISRTIVEAHGGRMWALSNNDQGATFQFTLPMVAGAHA
jgi:PAS domain S-box-containing protein